MLPHHTLSTPGARESIQQQVNKEKKSFHVVLPSVPEANVAKSFLFVVSKEPPAEPKLPINSKTWQVNLEVLNYIVCRRFLVIRARREVRKLLPLWNRPRY